MVQHSLEPTAGAVLSKGGHVSSSNTCELPQHLCFLLSCKMVLQMDSSQPREAGVHMASKKEIQVGAAEKSYSVWVFQPAQLR